MTVQRRVSVPKSLLLVVCVLTASGSCAFAVQPERPNIVFVMTDDQGPWALSCAGDPNAHTPNLDRLRKSGAMLTRCYAPTPVCSPARAAVLTSRYGTEIGIEDFLTRGDQESGLTDEFPTWPRLLSDAGYATALVGKYHCGQTAQAHPTRIGYDEFRGFIHGGMVSRDPDVEIGGQQRTVEGWTPDILTDYAIDFVRRKQSQPFALSLHYWAPHANRGTNAEGDRTWLPLSPQDLQPFASLMPTLPDPDYPQLDKARTRRMISEYLGSVHSVDRNVGRLLHELDQLNLTRRTLIILSSDHGYNLGHHGTWHKGNGRWLLINNQGSRVNMWDHSLRVPAVVSWPGRIEPGASVESTVSHFDWFPTILSAAGVERPQSVTLRGENILPLLEGASWERSDEFFAQYRMRTSHAEGADMRSYQTRRWKLVRYFRHVRDDEFYDRLNDPEETTDLSSSKDPMIQRAIRELTVKMQTKMREIDDPALR